MSAFGGKADMEITTYSTFGKSGKRAPHGSFMLCACFFGQSAVSSSSQSISLAKLFLAYRSITLIDRLPSRAQRLAVRMKTTKQTALKGKTHVKKRSHG
jgi:hypothetical protein